MYKEISSRIGNVLSGDSIQVVMSSRLAVDVNSFVFFSLILLLL